MSKVIGIVGSRRRDTMSDLSLVEEAFKKVYQPGDTIVSGGCPQGGDRFAEMIARNRRTPIPITIHKAQWRKFGKGAGFMRNGLIAEDADLLIACVSEDRTGGTEDTIGKFLRLKSKDNLILV